MRLVFALESGSLATTIDAFTGKNSNVPIDATTTSGQPVNVTYNNSSKGIELESTWTPMRELTVDLERRIAKSND